MGASEVAEEIFLCVSPFLVTQKNDLLFSQGGETTDESPVLAVDPISPQFKDICGSQAEIVEKVRALGVTDNLDALPGGQVAVNLPARFLEFFLQGGDIRFSSKLLFA